MNKEQQLIIKQYLESASPSERAELGRLLQKQQAPQSLSDINVSGMAKTMAQSIQQRMGITGSGMQQMAQNLVIEMARNYKPDITETELAALVDAMVPKQRPRRALPPEALLSMARQVIEYSSGIMTENERAELPDGWIELYWKHFPPSVQALLASCMKKSIDPASCWHRVRELLARV